MSQWLQWIILSSLTGSPLLSAVILLVFWWTVDRFTLGVLPDPLRWVGRWNREQKLKRTLEVAPHDRQARREWAELLVERRRYAKAVEVLKPALEAGDDDPASVFTMGVACLGAGHAQQGEKLLAHLAETKPDFRVGELDLALGRFRLKRKEFAPAKEALERVLKYRSGTVEGRVLLAQALEGLGDDGAAALKRDEAWREYVAAPRFQRRKERLWAWRARPSRPLMYGAVVVLALVFFGKVVAPALTTSARQPAPYAGTNGYDEP